MKEIIKQGRSAMMTDAIKIIRAIKESWNPLSERRESEVIKGFIQPDL